LTPLQKTLFDLHLKKFTGKVSLTRDQVSKTLYFKKGNPIYVESSIRSETLGQILLEANRLTEEQYQNVMQTMETSNKKQGDVLVELGYLTAFEVYESLQAQATRKFQNCFLLENARLNIEDGEDQIKEIPELSIDFFRVLLEVFGMFEDKDPQVIFPINRAIKLTGQGKQYLSTRTLSPGEVKLVRLLDGKRNFDQLMEEASGDLDSNSVLTITLKELGFLEFVDLPPQKFTVSVSRSETEKMAASQASSLADSSIREIVTVENKPKASTSPIYHWALRLDRPLQELLKVSTATLKPQIKQAYDSIVKELHLASIDEHYQDEKERDLAYRVLDRLTLGLTIFSDDTRRQQYLMSFVKSKTEQQPPVKISAEVHILKAKLHITKKKFEKAEEEIKKSLELNPEESSYHVFYAETLIQRAAFEKQPFPETIEQELRKALKLNSSDYSAFFQLGVLFKLRSDFEKARDLFNKVLQLKPNHPQAASELRLINLRLEEKKKGESTFLKLFKSKKKPPS